MIIIINKSWQFLSKLTPEQSTISLPICPNLPNFKTSERSLVQWSNSSYRCSPLYEIFCRLRRILNVLVKRNQSQASFQRIENLVFPLYFHHLCLQNSWSIHICKV